MSESIVNALVHLFAIFESVKENFEHDSGELVVKPYLKKTLNQELTNEYLHLFYDYLDFYREANKNPSGNHELGIDSTSIIQIAKICNQINKELLQHERYTVFMELLELIRADEKVSDKEGEFASLVAMNFNLKHREVEDIKAFVFEPDTNKISFDHGLIIDNKMTEWPEEMAWLMRKKKSENSNKPSYHHMYVENMFGRILVLQLESINSYVFRYDGPLNLYMEGNKIQQRKTYLLKPGIIIKGPNIRSIYETEITTQFLKEKTRGNIVLNGEELEFHFADSTNGIQKFNFSEVSGNLVGIMGGSGTGKSTLLNLLNGKIDPKKGRVHINGHTIQRAGREGVIGYVPQDDLLFEELTVYQNLYYNARICFCDFSEGLIKKTVDKILNDMDLMETRDLKVGDPLNKSISGGQRKRLNIALELMREPSVLFVDEPTSGLSSTDSEKVMLLLKEQARKGRLVIVIIHQPSSDIYKLFDKLWILDKGGYPIYNGNPIDAIVYFKTMSTQVNAAESECQRCGNVIPDQILQIIESKEIDDSGHATVKRKVSPKEWYLKYKENIEKNLKRFRHNEMLPPSNFRIPGLLRQFLIFGQRNFVSKLANRQYMLINILEAPFLALILGYFSKYDGGGIYIFSENKNLPVFIFMSIVVSMFMGMSVSAEEIFKDRKILERESFLNLSWLSYLNSKIAFLFTLSAFQSICYVLVAHYVLEIKGQVFLHWAILFSTACFANLVGLTISSALNSIIAIYILIPFILVPQMLLGGAMINFDDLHSNFTNKKYVPFVGDLMVSRWSYEALAVAQFKHNKYEANFFDVEQQMSESSFVLNYIMPRLESLIAALEEVKEKDKYGKDFRLLRSEIKLLPGRYNVKPFEQADELIQPAYFNDNTSARLKNYLKDLTKVFRMRYNNASAAKDSIYYQLVDQIGKDDFLVLRQTYFNQALSDVVTNRNKLDKVYVGEEEYIQKKDPIYTRPYTHLGRAHLFAPFKMAGNQHIDTVLFNIMVIWIFTLFLYFVLAQNYLKRMLTWIQNQKMKRKLG